MVGEIMNTTSFCASIRTYCLVFGLAWLCCDTAVFGQDNNEGGLSQTLHAVVLTDAAVPVQGASVSLVNAKGRKVESTSTDVFGKFQCSSVTSNMKLLISAIGYEPLETSPLGGCDVANPCVYVLQSSTVILDGATIEGEDMGVEWMGAMRDGGLYRGMKSTVLRPAKQLVVPGEFQARNVFSGLPGANVWESDGAGLQLGVGVRGLSPNRSSHMSMRQNGIPIAADPLGYPEAYYTPPLHMVQSVQHVMGANALQYGSQLGGMLNFIMESADWNERGQVKGISSTTSYAPDQEGFVGHQMWGATFKKGGENTAGLVSVDHRRGSGWRPQSDFESTTAFASLKQRFSGENGVLTLEHQFSWMRRQEQQSGGLTDAQFALNPRASYRERNWFKVAWNLASTQAHWRPSQSPWEVHLKVHGLIASRVSLGFLGTPNRVDPLQERGLIDGGFKSVGTDIRTTRRWEKKGSDQWHALVLGLQAYSGNNNMSQGLGTAGEDADFSFLTPDEVDGSTYRLPNKQVASFAQAIVAVGERLSLTPGLRLEWIESEAEGVYREVIYNGAGGIVEDSLFSSYERRSRGVLLPGIGFSWLAGDGVEVYGNAVANYRAINFSDIQLSNLGVVIDPEIKDERGYNMDLGFRKKSNILSLDVGIFGLWYRDKIGLITTTVPDPVLIERPVLLRTNLSNARTVGVEAAISKNWMLSGDETNNVTIQLTGSYMQSEYLEGGLDAIQGKQVEFVPQWTSRLAATWNARQWHVQVHFDGTASQFTEATNAIRTPNALYGEIPSRFTLDLAVGRSLGNRGLHLGLKLNNATNTMYFTRRALAYPGPGILPADGRNVRLAISYSPSR
jgi:Fe(3+) dicitrate transport protein